MRRWFAKGWGSVVELLPLAAKIQLLNDGLVTFEVFAFQVIEQLSSFRRHHEQAPSGMEILSVGLQVLGQVSDAFGKQGDLHLAGSRVLFMDPVFLYYVLFVDVFGHDLFIWFLGTWVLPLQNRASAEAGVPLRLVPACLGPVRGSPRRQPEIGWSLTQADESCRFSVPVQAETLPVAFPVAKLGSSLTIEFPWTYPISPMVPT